ncbi:MBL fold metallo-hydrolase [Thalassolituus marinus]|nr:MBL fold metallo-hydrolase [Thalassolituus marinus]
MNWTLITTAVLVAAIAIPLFLGACSARRVQADQQERFAQSAQYQQDHQRFANPVPTPEQGLGDLLGIMWEMSTAKDPQSAPDIVVPTQPLTAAQLASLPTDEHRVYRLGHSTMLLSLNGEVWLLDPVFSERASPVQWAGPERFHPLPLNPQDLPPLKGIVISHDHYDHLDEGSIRQLADKAEGFYVPLGLGRYLQQWGVAADRIVEHDWWQETRVGDTLLAATPTQHFSGRGLFSRDSTLWASWVIERDGRRYFFSGDSGYFAGFKQIGERYGPFDLTMMENGAYNERWGHIHMMPEESVQAHLDLGGQRMLPIHNSTFDLSIHAWFEPLQRVSDIASQRGVELVTPIIGEPVVMGREQAFSLWWQSLMPQQIASAETATLVLADEVRSTQ